MRPLVDQAVPDLPCPDESLLVEARRAEAGSHACLLDRIDAFQAIEFRAPPRAMGSPERLRVAALNAERLKRPRAVRRLIDDVGAHVVLMSEVDVGMARSGNTHTIRDFIGSSDHGYLFGAEFVELDLGDEREMRNHAGERNACSLHGNAIVSALNLEQPHVIPLEESGLWFKGINGAQRRIGGRIAVAARVSNAPRPLWLVSLHLESKTDPADRQKQILNLLRALDSIAPNEACLIGGDCNTKALPRGEGERTLLLQEPERFEPLFGDLRKAGFVWTGANLGLPTQRDGPEKTHPRPFGKLDWLFVRGVKAENPQVVPSLDESGQPFSDHEMVCVDILL
ncbi:endonuclease/exonuclease/phosphatase family protein [Microvirga solisilvae]|uniref:endonuclease/exonuclease/phosphatase family protein n=1 Tax=Microvirga solisilvae TaxID=2919498 RepID=UPI001FAFD127|nr:endonuclease/exonuclease/phosphatase family protein [Microvirga solisilvae]